MLALRAPHQRSAPGGRADFSMRRTIPLIATLASFALAAPAFASTTDTIIRDCQHSQTGYLTGSYTKAQLRRALNNLPSDVLEYSGCYDQIKQALRDAALGTGGGGSGGSGRGGIGGGTSTGGGDPTGSDGTTGTAGAPPVEHVGSRAPVTIAGTTVKPGAIRTIGHDARELPTPLVVLLVLLGLGALAPTATTIGRRVVGHRRG